MASLFAGKIGVLISFCAGHQGAAASIPEEAGVLELLGLMAGAGSWPLGAERMAQTKKDCAGFSPLFDYHDLKPGVAGNFRGLQPICRSQVPAFPRAVDVAKGGGHL